MEALNAIILGIVQGLTEFLPVSSSGHLVIFQELLNFNTPGIIMEVILHAGTLLAVLFFYRKELHKLSSEYLTLIAIGTIPAGIIGLLFNNSIESLFQSLTLVAFALIVTGVMNFYSDKQKTSKSGLNPRDALIIGLFQAFAIIPGISRSGATIFSALVLGKERSEAAKFSFLLSVPAILGANILELATFEGSLGIDYMTLIVGLAVSFVVGVFAIKLMVNFVKSRTLKIFAVYTFILGISILVFR